MPMSRTAGGRGLFAAAGHRPDRPPAAQAGIAIELKLQDLKGPILNGQEGYSPKGPEPGNASYYISRTRLQAGGTVSTADGVFTVRGLSWMDHEYSTSALGPELVGWDWFSLQLDDGSGGKAPCAPPGPAAARRSADGAILN